MEAGIRYGYFPYKIVGEIYNGKLPVIIFPYKSTGF